MPLPRMTTRRWMIVVATLAVGLSTARAFERLGALRSEYEVRAAIHAWFEEIYAHAEKYDGLSFGCHATGPFRANPSLDPKLAGYHAGLKGKYTRAARRPWLPVPPDPPEPK